MGLLAAQAQAMTQQSQIEVEAEAGKMLRSMVQFGHCRCTRITPPAQWLLDQQYAYRANGRLYITEPNPKAKTQVMTGREYYEGLCRNPGITRSPRAWTEEAQSGITVKRGRLGHVSARSRIERAAVPTIAPPHTTRTPEDILNDNERTIAARKKLCADLEVTESELRRLMDEHRVEHCNGCKAVGIFDRRGDRGLQHLCRRCRRKRRGK